MAETIGLRAIMDLDNFNRGVNSYLNDIDRMNRGTTNIAASIANEYGRLGGVIVGTLGAVGLAVGSIAAFGAKELVEWTVGGIQANAEYEQSLADIGSVLQQTREEIQPLADLIDEMALDPMLVVSSQEASAAVEQLARNGLTMTDIVGGAAKAVVLLANSTGGDFGKAADVATMAMQQFNLKAEDMNKVADISQGVINHTRMELKDWALALGNSGGAANMMNVSLEDTAAVLAMTLPMYHSARQAGTGFTNFLLRTVPITETSADAMRELGLFSGLTGKAFTKMGEDIDKTEKKIAALDPTSKNYQRDLEALTATLAEQHAQMNVGNNAFFDAQGNFVGMSEASRLLKDATQDLSHEQLIAAFRVIFGNDALETAIGLAEGGSVAFEEVRGKVVQYGSAAEAAATRTDTLAAKWENLGDIWDAIQRKSGAGFEDTLRRIVERMTELTGDNQDKIIHMFERLGVLVDELVEKFWPWIEEQLPLAIDNVVALADWLMELVRSGDAWNENLDKMSPGFREWVERIIGVFEWLGKLKDNIVNAYTEIKNFLQPLIDWVKEHVEWSDVLLMVEGAIIAFLIPLGFALTKMAAVGAAVTLVIGYWEEWGGATGVLQTAIDLFNGALEFLSTTVGELIPGLQTTDDEFLNWYGSTVQLKDIVAALGIAWALFNAGTLLPLIVNIAGFGLAVAAIAIVVAEVRTAWEEDWGGMKTFFTQLWDDLEEPVLDFIENVLGGKWELAWFAAKFTATFALQSVVDYVKGLAETYFPNLVDALSQVNNAFSGPGSWVGQDNINRMMTFEEKLEKIDLTIANMVLRWEKFWSTDFTNLGKFDKQIEENQKRIDEINEKYEAIRKENLEKAIADQISTLEKAVTDYGTIGGNAGAAFNTGVYKALTDYSKITIVLDELKKSLSSVILSPEDVMSKVLGATPDIFGQYGDLNLTGKPISFIPRSVIEQFTSDIQAFAYAINQGFLDAGSESIEAYIDGFTSKYGFAENKTKELAYDIIESLTGQSRFYKRPGEEATEQYAEGIEAGGDTVSGAWKVVFDTADQFGIELPPEMFAAGLAATSEHGAGVVAGAPTAVDAYNFVREQILAETGELPPEMEKAGEASSTGLATGIDKGRYPVLASIQELFNGIIEGGGKIPTAFDGFGTQLVDKLTGEILFSTNLPVSSVQEMIRLMINEGATLPAGFTDFGNLSMVNLKTGVETGDDAAIAAFATVIGEAGEAGIGLSEEYLALGQAATEQLKVGVEAGDEVAVAAFAAVFAAAGEAGVGLSGEYLLLGQAATEQLKIGVEAGDDAAIAAFTAVVAAAKESGVELPPDFLAIGGESITNLGTGATGQTEPAKAAFGAVIDATYTTVEQVVATFENLGISAIQFMVQGMYQEVERIDLDTTKNLLVTRFFQDLLETVFPQNGTGLIENMAFGMDQGLHFVTEFLNKLTTGTLEPWWAETVEFFNDRAQQAMAEATAGLISQQDKFKQVFTDLKKFLTDWWAEIIKQANDRGQQTMAEAAAGLITQKSKVIDFFNTLRTEILEIGADIKTKFVATFDGLVADVAAKFAGLSGAVNTAVNVGSFRTIGENIGGAFVQGVESKIGAAQTAVNNLVALAATAATTAAQIASPSRVFMKIGSQSAEGYIVGWENMMVFATQRLTKSMNVLTGSLSQRLSPVAPAMAGASTSNTYNYRTNQVAPNFDINVRDERDAHRLTQIIRKVIGESL